MNGGFMNDALLKEVISNVIVIVGDEPFKVPLSEYLEPEEIDSIAAAITARFCMKEHDYFMSPENCWDCGKPTECEHEWQLGNRELEERMECNKCGRRK